MNSPLTAGSHSCTLCGWGGCCFYLSKYGILLFFLRVFKKTFFNAPQVVIGEHTIRSDDVISDDDEYDDIRFVDQPVNIMVVMLLLSEIMSEHNSNSIHVPHI